MKQWLRSIPTLGGLIFFGGVLLGVGVSWKTLHQEELAFVQQSLGDAVSWVTAQVNTQIDRWTLESRRVLDLVPITNPKDVKSVVSEKVTAPGIKVTPYSEIETIDMSPEILDVSLWRKEGDWVRSKTVMNGRFISPAGDWGSRLMAQNELTLLNQASKGHTVLVGNWSLALGSDGFLTLAYPWNDGQVVLTHIQLAVLAPMIGRKGQTSGSLLWVEIVDSEKKVLASAAEKNLGTTAQNVSAGIYNLAAGPEMSGMPAGQVELKDPELGKVFGAFHRAKNGVLIVAYVGAQGLMTGAGVLILHGLPYCLLVFFALFVLGRFYKPEHALIKPVEDKKQITPAQMEPRRVQAVVVHGVLREVSWMVEQLAPAEVQENFKELMRMVDYRRVARNGKLESALGGRFTIYWTHEHELDQALMFALELRQDLNALNEARKVDGARPITLGLGICTLGVVEGPDGLMGDAFDMARSLEMLTRITGTDILVAQNLWTQVSDQFLGECMGEAKLTRDTGLLPYYSLRGFRTVEGEEVFLETPYSGKTRAEAIDVLDGVVGVPQRATERPVELKKWLINNGSQIVGPHSAEVIAAQLFSQELDFDCECWEDGTGESSKIGEAKIFTGSQDAGASFWVYDGTTVHGPLSRGFLLTAIKHGVMDPKAAYLCTGSTIAGWKLLEEWLSSFPPEKGSGSQAA